ncbi:MAG: DUF1064 domain-containing protein [Acidobacteriota bacterium]
MSIRLSKRSLKKLLKEKKVVAVGELSESAKQALTRAVKRSGSKFKNRHVRLDGYTFDSQREADRYGELILLAKAGKISRLLIHERHPITVNGHLVAIYESDFTYLNEHGRKVIEDVKGVRTEVYKIKRALMKATLGIEIVEID